jgi:hypothetical protein
MKRKSRSEIEILRREFQRNLFEIAKRLKESGYGVSRVTLSRILGAFPLPLQKIKEPEIQEFLGLIENPDLLFKEEEPKEIFGNKPPRIRFYLLLVEFILSCRYPKVKTGPKISEEARSKWEKEKQIRMHWAVRIPNDVIYSHAFLSLDSPVALKVLMICHMKTRQRKIQGKRRGKEKYELVDEGRFSFTYSEAHLLGFSVGQFSRALKELHSRGFIDIAKMGSGLRGDFSEFRLSERWRNFGTERFQSVEFPKAVGFGFRGSSSLGRGFKGKQ